MAQSPIALGTVQTRNKKTDSAPKSFQSEHQTKDNRWRQTDRGAQGSNKMILRSVVGSSFCTLALSKCSVLESKPQVWKGSEQ